MGKKEISKKTENKTIDRLAYFDLEEFERIYKQEKVNIIQEHDVKELKHKLVDIKEYKNLNEYFEDTVYFTTEGSIFVKMRDVESYNPFVLKSYSVDGFGKAYGKFITNLLPKYTDTFAKRYIPNIYSGNFDICKETRRINLARPFNYTHKPDFKPTEETRKKADEVLSFMSDIICAKNQDVFNKWKMWISCLTKRKQTEALVYLVGKGGTGKSTVLKCLQNMLGAGSQAMTENILSGSDMFNNQMAGTVLGYVEETAEHSHDNYEAKKITRTLKRLSTEQYVTVRKMQCEGYSVLNIINFLIITNDVRDVIPNRRTWTIEPSVERQGDKRYFARINELICDRDVLQLLFNEFYENKCEDFLKVEINNGELNADVNSAKTRDSYMQEFLFEHFVLKNNSKQEMTTKQLYKYFVDNNIGDKKAEEYNEKFVKADIRNLLVKTGNQFEHTDLYDVSKDGITKRLKVNNWTEERFVREKERIEGKQFAPLIEDDEDKESKTIKELKAEIQRLNERLKQYEEKKEEVKVEVVKVEVKEEEKKPELKIEIPDEPIIEIVKTQITSSQNKKIRREFATDLQQNFVIKPIKF